MERLKLSIAALALLCGTALAEPPPVGWTGAFSRVSFLCDTAEQLQSIVDAFAVSTETARLRFGELYALKNGKSEPTCAATAIRSFTAGESIDHGVIQMGAASYHGWSVNVVNSAGAGWYLYLEPAAEPMRFQDREGAV